MGLSVSGSMKRRVQESGRCVQFRWSRYTEQTGFTEKPVRKSQGFCLKREKQRIWFLDGTEEYGKVVWQGMQKIFSKKGCCLEEEQYLEIPKDRDLRRMFYKIRLAGLALSADMLVFASAVQGAEAVGYLHDLEIKVPEEIEVMAVGKEETALICRPQLTTVEFDKKRFVRQAIEELYVQMIKGYILTKSGKISVKTIIRGSCN